MIVHAFKIKGGLGPYMLVLLLSVEPPCTFRQTL